MKLVLTAIGKRVELINHLKTEFTVVGVDCSDFNVARNFVDEFYVIPRCTDPDYVQSLADICEREKAAYLIPLYEDEFEVLSAHRIVFERIGTTLLLSGEKVLDICKDKFKTDAFFRKYNIPAPRSYKPGDPDIKYPVIIKPSLGMGSEGVNVVNDPDELPVFVKRTDKPIIQEKIDGREYTIDILCDLDGNIIYNVARERLEVRSGEVTKSRIVMNKDITDLTAQVMKALKSEDKVMGPFTLQCFVTKDGKPVMLEINPRFGGGVPLSFAGGANYAKALWQMAYGATIVSEEITPKTMLRYDSSVFTD